VPASSHALIALAPLSPAMCGEMNTPGADHSGWSAGSGSGSTTSSTARIRPACSSARRGGIDYPPASGVYDERAVAKPTKHGGVDYALGLLSQGSEYYQSVCATEQFREILQTMDSFSWGSRDTDDLGAQCLQADLHRAADRAQSKDEDYFVGHLIMTEVLPMRRGLGSNGFQQSCACAEQRRKHPLGNGHITAAGCRTERHPVGERRSDPVRTSRHDLHNLQTRELTKDGAYVIAFVIEDQEVDLS